jgi:hypothetical protein
MVMFNSVSLAGAAAILLVLTFPAKSQIPFYTDDADTTHKGKFHFEFYNEHDLLQKVAFPSKRQNTAVFTLNYGITKRLEFDVNAPLLSIVNAKGTALGNPTGIGDTQFGLKFTVHDESESSKIPALAVVFYVEVPTGNTKKELGSGLTDYWLYGVVQKSFTKKTIGRLNGGILFAGDDSTGLIGLHSSRGQIITGNGSLTKDFTPKLRLGAEIFGAVTSKFKLSRGQLEAQVGGNYQLSERFSLAFGILGGRFEASPRAGVLIGFAYDFK